MKLAHVAAALVTLGVVAAACDSATDSQTADHREGVLGLAPLMAYGDTVTGQVVEPQIDVWSIDVRAGDKLRIQETVTGGDLRPDVVLFQGAMGEHTRSSDFEANGPNLTKDYQLDHNARFFIVVRGYRGQGSGSYSLSLSCLGGPCAGEVPPPPVVELSKTEQHNCVEAARVCAVAALPEYSGAVGAVRAQQIFDRCLSEQTVETYHSDVPASCAPACQSEDGSFVCDAVVALLPWLADQTSACVDEFNGCVESCYDAGYDGARESLEEGGEAVCVTGEIAFNGSCRDVAELEVCGGRWAEDSCEACYLGCHSTAGAWMDDLDTICDEECNCEVSDDF